MITILLGPVGGFLALPPTASMPAAPNVSRCRGRFVSQNNGFPDAPHVLVDVADQTEHDELLGRHGWRIGTRVRSSPADRRSGPGSPLPGESLGDNLEHHLTVIAPTQAFVSTG
jgi:hypothetical protein